MLFGENVTPNPHKLAREFVLLDNFYVNADVSADGHNWSTAAIAPDYVQKLWPNKYAGRRKLYDFEEQDPASLPPAGYLWTNAHAAGLSHAQFRLHGGQQAKDARAGRRADRRACAIRCWHKVTNRYYRGFDLDYSDVERAKTFLDDLAECEKSGEMPRLMVMRLGNDHTSGTTPGKIAPLAMAADNDQARRHDRGSGFEIALLEQHGDLRLEDDAQNGPDHVDSHRSPALRDFAVRQAPHGGQHHVQHHFHAAHHGVDSGPASHDPLRRGARPMFARLPEHAPTRRRTRSRSRASRSIDAQPAARARRGGVRHA